MFNGCTALSLVRITGNATWDSGKTSNWLASVAEAGFIDCPDEVWVTMDRPSVSGVPAGWSRIVGVFPGELNPDSYSSADLAMASVKLTVPDAVIESDMAADDYRAMFKAVAVPVGADEFRGTLVLKDELAEQVEENFAGVNMAVLLDALLSAKASGEKEGVSLTGCLPGLFYSVESAAALADEVWTESERIFCGPDGAVELEVPCLEGDSGFLRVKASYVPGQGL